MNKVFAPFVWGFQMFRSLFGLLPDCQIPTNSKKGDVPNNPIPC